MRYLIDTHALLWWWLDDGKLPQSMRSVLGDRGNDIHVSSVSGWEIATKVRLGKLPQMARRIHDYDALVTGDGFRHLPVRQNHGVKAGLLRGRHRDPFDRMLAAQALMEEMVVVTRDPAFATFGCKVAW
ncbi:MAG TPA: type II toxin-antitoxin system VapC family toxin [Allosphingosinicella sp.]|nr:type II toxin-antitoxin system VapC family toxin [Allosphingosinicella sp.]